MANYTFNIAKGRPASFYERVASNDPANSAIILIPLSAQGTESEAQDYDTVAAVLAGTSNEQTTSWSRVTLTNTELAAFPSPNDTDNRYDLSVPEVSFGSPTVGNDVVALLIAYDPDTTGGTDANLIPISSHTFAVTADGNEVVLLTGNFMRSS